MIATLQASMAFVGASLLANKRGAMRFASKLAPTKSTPVRGSS
ncbi:hypothetical protein PCLA_08f0048 [Pseudomonas citronellolis]|nr:hypothetical protein PCLA_08f0048 [Pseudomonas citronellolis]